MEDLTKQQMVLLTVLVAFVCSTATSIMIVSLLTDSAAPTISQTINRVVEKTIERVVTGSSTPIFIKQPPVIPAPSESEKVVSAVNDNLSKMVSIHDREKAGESATSTAKIAIGAIVSSDGLIVTDNSLIDGKTEFTVFFGDKYRHAKKAYFDNTLHLAFLKLEDAVKDDPNMQGIVFSPPSYVQEDLKLGMPVIALGGENGKSIMRGTLTDIPDKKTSPLVAGDIALSGLYKGGILFGLDGKVMGIILSNAEGTPEITPYSNIISSVSAYRILKTEAVKP